LRPFVFSRDGYTVVALAAGDRADVPDALVPGLVAGGFVREAEAEAAPEPPPPVAAAIPTPSAAAAAPNRRHRR
jgi:hypothetical protein